MKYVYCPQCGEKLIARAIGDEGCVPYCAGCAHPWFDGFNTCILALVANRKGEIAVLKQAYLSERYGNLVSGYMKPGETAEACALREVFEETGLRIGKPHIAFTHWYPPGGVLMIAMIAGTNDDTFTLSDEVDSAFWLAPEAARTLLPPAETGNACRTLLEYYESHKNLIE